MTELRRQCQADGVGGWADKGIDSADFSHGICESMADNAARYDLGQQTTRLHARDLLESGYQRIIRDRSLRGGGSTACVGIARNEGTLEVAK